MLDIASPVPASQKHRARVAKHNTSLKLPLLFLQQLPGLKHDSQKASEEKNMWHVLGQMSQVLQWTLGHLNLRVWAESLHSSAVNSICFALRTLTHTEVPCCVTGTHSKTFGMRYKPQIRPSMAMVEKKSQEIVKESKSQVTPALPKNFHLHWLKDMTFFYWRGSQCNYRGICYFQSGLLLDTTQYGNAISTARVNCFRMC